MLAILISKLYCDANFKFKTASGKKLDKIIQKNMEHIDIFTF